MSEFAKRLRELRRTNKVTQKELGKHLGYGFSAISNYEKKINEPSLDVLIKVANFFDVSVDYIIGNIKEIETLDQLMPKEKEMVKHFKNIDEKNQDLVLKITEALINK